MTLAHCARKTSAGLQRQNDLVVKTSRLYNSQRKRRRRKHYHAPAKQDTSKQPPLDRKSYWHGNENTQPSKTLRLCSETTRRALKATIPAQRHKNDTLQVIQTTCKTLSPVARPYIPLADACGRLQTLCERSDASGKHMLTPRPPSITGTLLLRIRENSPGSSLEKHHRKKRPV